MASKGFINGKWVGGSDGKTFDVINPATGAKLVEVPNMPREQVKEAIVSTASPILTWHMTERNRLGGRKDRFHLVVDDERICSTSVAAQAAQSDGGQSGRSGHNPF